MVLNSRGGGSVMAMIGNFIGIPRIAKFDFSSIAGGIEFIAPGNTGKGQNGNWKLEVNANNGLDLIKIKGGSEIIVTQNFI